MTRTLLLTALLAGCAPVYRPPAPFAPMLQEKGDAQVAAHLGIGGFQVDGAVAPDDLVALRGGIQVGGYVGEGTYTVGTVGVGVYGAEEVGGLRAAVSLVGGGGYSRGVSDWTVSTQTPSGGTNADRVRFENSGPIVVAAIRSEFGYETEWFATGATLCPTYHQVWHDERSDGVGVGRGAMIETAALVRAGPPPVGIEGFLGVALPFWADGDIGVPFPLTFGLGLTVDSPTRRAPGRPVR